MTDTTEPRAPRVDPPVGPTPTTCTFADIYGWRVLCGQVDPCSPDGTSTLWFAQDCTAVSPTMAEFCATYVDHPACPPVVVELGTPPTLPTTLPATGLVGGAVGLGLYFLVVGCLVAGALRWSR